MKTDFFDGGVELTTENSADVLCLFHLFEEAMKNKNKKIELCMYIDNIGYADIVQCDCDENEYEESKINHTGEDGKELKMFLWM